MRSGNAIMVGIVCLALLALYDFGYNAIFVHLYEQHILRGTVEPEWFNLLLTSGVPALLQMAVIGAGLYFGALGKTAAGLLAFVCVVLCWMNILVISCEPYAC